VAGFKTKSKMKLLEKFKPMVNGYVGSSMLTNTEYPETIEANAKKCVEISNKHTSNFLRWLNENDFSFYEGGIIRHGIVKTVLSYEQVLEIYDQTPK
jgi:hypothetical protein